MDRGSAQPDPSAHPPAGPRRIPRPAAATRYHGSPDEAEDEGRADPGRGPHAAEPPPRDAVSRRLREPVPCGAATRRPAGPEANPSFEGETRRIPSNKLNAERRLQSELTTSRESSTRRRMRFQRREESQRASPQLRGTDSLFRSTV